MCKNLKGKFPSYFKNFELPNLAGENHYNVYRACRTGLADAQSFLCTFEQNGFQISQGAEITEPDQYSLSTYEKPKDVKRFATMNSEFGVPFKIAVGTTDPIYGYSKRSKEWNPKKCKTSHVDWWLFENAKPYVSFELIENFERFFVDYKKEEKKNE